MVNRWSRVVPILSSLSKLCIHLTSKVRFIFAKKADSAFHWRKNIEYIRRPAHERIEKDWYGLLLFLAELCTPCITYICRQAPPNIRIFLLSLSKLFWNKTNIVTENFNVAHVQHHMFSFLFFSRSTLTFKLNKVNSTLRRAKISIV